MIARIHPIAEARGTIQNPRAFAGASMRRQLWGVSAILFAVVVFAWSYTTFLTSANEIVHSEPLEPQGFLGDKSNWLTVKVFDPTTGQWRETTKQEVVPGEEFVAMDTLFKEYIYGWMSDIHGEIDIAKLEDAYRQFDPKSVRRPTGEDVVYVFGQNLPRTGFQKLSLVGPGETFRFQGRVYQTTQGARFNTLRIVDTGKTLAKPGGDPNPKALPLLLSAQTAHRFPDTPKYMPKPAEGVAHDDVNP